MFEGNQAVRAAAQDSWISCRKTSCQGRLFHENCLQNLPQEFKMVGKTWLVPDMPQNK
jgi:hypothetical protein